MAEAGTDDRDNSSPVRRLREEKRRAAAAKNPPKRIEREPIETVETVEVVDRTPPQADPSPDGSPPKWFTVADAAAYLGTTASTIYRLCAARKIDHVRIGIGAGRVQFVQANLDAYIKSATVSARPEEEELPTGTHVPAKYFRPRGSPPLPKRRA